jgi:lipopolysaccharide/colanic/teichoic acid biosynthesis glycosyltransferase
MDVIGAGVLLLLLSPVLLTVLAIVLVTSRGRPIFAQERVGFLGRTFRLYKFRTMVLDAEQLRTQVKNEQRGPVFKNQADPRITRFGKLLRRTSIDEMPQLLNILLGDMSLVGPRPPLAAEVALYEPWQRIRLAVKPGLTCLWQVSGRSEIGFEQWMLMDSWYVRHQGILTDIGLLWRTPWAVLSRRGAY